MIILITGASHTGKTLLAQRLLERYKFPYLSMDHVKMGLIRSGNTTLTPYDDDRMTDYLWPIVREIIKTAIENSQNLIVEGCYVPADWADDFSPEYLRHINLRCLVMTEKYIKAHAGDLRAYQSVIERRLYEDFNPDAAVAENKRFLSAFGKDKNAVVLIENDYFSDLEAGLHLPEPNENSNSIHLVQEEKRMHHVPESAEVAGRTRCEV